MVKGWGLGRRQKLSGFWEEGGLYKGRGSVLVERVGFSKER